MELYLGGQGVGEAADQLLFGEVNPSGHLAESFPYQLEDNPSYLFFPGDGHTVRYAEDVFVGYRYYDTKKMPVRWAFGHGLSYTTFAMGNLKLSDKKMDDTSRVSVSVEVTNTGSVKGKQVVQLYISDRNGTVERPLKELKGFAKTELMPGETKTVSMEISARDLSYYNEALGDWYTITLTFEQVDAVRHGHRVAAPEVVEAGKWGRAISEEGELVALIEYDAEANEWQPRKVFFS